MNPTKTETDIGARGLAHGQVATPSLLLVESSSPSGQALVDLLIPLAEPVTIGRSPGNLGLTIAVGLCRRAHSFALDPTRL